MVSSFHYRGSAYLVLEYAQRGDLHTFLLKCGHQSHAHSSHHGSIGGYLMQHHAWLRFVVGEIAAAVQVLHAHGFVYNDLKPENVLLTEMGHVKVSYRLFSHVILVGLLLLLWFHNQHGLFFCLHELIVLCLVLFTGMVVCMR